jgi:NAD(P)-dependent dehydrogenase (short-subunit alcohol dehydrogenase family)
MDLELTDKIAVVTGAGKGIGLAVTRALADEGARVIAGSRTTEALDDIDGVSGVAGDLAAPDGPAELIARAIDEHGRVDVLVNNVGAARIRVGGFFGTSDEELAVDLGGAVRDRTELPAAGSAVLGNLRHLCSSRRSSPGDDPTSADVALATAEKLHLGTKLPSCSCFRVNAALRLLA